MKDVTIILGDVGVGKSHLAYNMCEGRKVEVISFLNDIHELRGIPRNTDLIVIDDYGGKNLSKLNSFISSETMSVRYVYEPNITQVERPEVIVVSNTLAESDFVSGDHIKIIML